MVKTRNLSQYAAIHETRRYGDTGVHKLRIIEPWVRFCRPSSILDYGAGQSDLVNRIASTSLEVRDRYDPAIAAISVVPKQRYDMIVCTDVFEHLDEEEVSEVLDDILSLSDLVVFCIDTREASTVLPSGENAHATVRPSSWWLSVVRQHFPSAEIVRRKGSSIYIKTWKSNGAAHIAARIMGKIAKFGGRGNRL